MEINENQNENQKPLEDKLFELRPIYSEFEIKDTVRDILYVLGYEGDELENTVDMVINELNHRRERGVY